MNLQTASTGALRTMLRALINHEQRTQLDSEQSSRKSAITAELERRKG